MGEKSIDVNWVIHYRYLAYKWHARTVAESSRIIRTCILLTANKLFIYLFTYNKWAPEWTDRYWIGRWLLIIHQAGKPPRLPMDLGGGRPQRDATVNKMKGMTNMGRKIGEQVPWKDRKRPRQPWTPNPCNPADKYITAVWALILLKVRFDPFEMSLESFGSVTILPIYLSDQSGYRLWFK